MIDPRDIERVEFKATRIKEGYDQDEVDNFLDRVASDYKSLLASNAALEAEVAQYKRVNAEQRRQLEARSEAPTTQLPVIQAEPTEAAARLLNLAQKTADEVVAQAQQNAVDITARADENARDIVNAATKEADERRRKAEALAYQAEERHRKIVEVANSTRDHLDAQLSNLRQNLGEDPQ